MRAAAVVSALAGWCVVSCLTTTVHAQAKDNPWARVTAPSTGEAAPIGEYTSGCLRGASQLPLDGAGYQVMHPGRVRYFGHPDLVTFIQQLGQSVRGEKLGDLMVGDLSQPRGGPAPGGHSSHQTGLDVDLWYWQPAAATRGPLPRADRDSTKARSVLDPKTATIKADESVRTLTLLRLTAKDTHVARIFVHPIIKRDACKMASADDRAWLHKLRPWFGHDDHFHVRLECPLNATECVVQSPVPQGDGCNELDWWFSPEAQADRAKGQAKYQAKVGKAPGMPKLCTTLLDKSVPVPVAHADERASTTTAAKPGLQSATATAATTGTTP